MGEVIVPASKLIVGFVPSRKGGLFMGGFLVVGGD